MHTMIAQKRQRQFNEYDHNGLVFKLCEAIFVIVLESPDSKKQNVHAYEEKIGSGSKRYTSKK